MTIRGSLEEGWLFKGRFGTDLQVLMPGINDAEVCIKQTAILDKRPNGGQSFTMRHLQVSKQKVDNYIGVLRPLYADRSPVSAEPILLDEKSVGTAIRGDGIEDIIICSRESIKWEEEGVRFEGRYGALIQRPDQVTLILLDGMELEYKDIRITSDGPAVQLEVRGDELSIITKGSGDYSITRDNKTQYYSTNTDVR